MKALILAAGVGSRLAPITDTCPKSLVPVNGIPILIKQIENLHENGIKEITIIAGYKADILEKTIHELYPEINIICSHEYKTTNNMYSAYLAKNIMEHHSFLMMNADVFLDASVIRKLLEFPEENAIVTDIGKYNEESMKIVVANDKVVKISKAISAECAFGVSIDVYKFSEEGGKYFFRKCVEYIEGKKENNLWSEVALNDILSEIEFKACPLEGRWIEIDDHKDLKKAEIIFSRDGLER